MILVGLASTDARAASTARVRLILEDSSGAPGCLDEPRLRRAIAERAGYDPIVADAPDAIVVTVTRAAGRVVARVDLLDPGGAVVGARSLDAPDSECGELLQAVALSVGIALDRVERGPAVPDPPARVTPPPASSPAESEPVPEPLATAGSSGWRAPSLSLFASASALAGVAPALAIAPGIGVSARWGRFDLGLEGWLQLPASSVTGSPPTLVRTRRAGGGPQACVHGGVFFGCVTTFVGVLSADAPGSAGTVTKTGVQSLGGIRGGVAIPLAAGLSARLALDALADPHRLDVVVAAQHVFRPSAFDGGGEIGVGWTIP